LEDDKIRIKEKKAAENKITHIILKIKPLPKSEE
jgi:hypothetical protein